jgi:hypothetical protein
MSADGQQVGLSQPLKFDDVPQRIASDISADTIANLLSLAKRTLTKSVSAVVMGVILVLFAYYLRPLLILAIQYGLTKSPPPTIHRFEIWIAAGTFAIIGLYLIFIGCRCWLEARLDVKVMRRALVIKRQS